MRTLLAILTISVALLVGFAAGAQTSEPPFDGYWWRAASYREKAAFVWGWQFGTGTGEMWGCTAGVADAGASGPAFKTLVGKCVTDDSYLTKLNGGVSGVSIPGEIIGLVDRFYDDPRHAAEAPGNAIVNVLQARRLNH